MWALFFSSYTPLFLLLVLRSIQHSRTVAIASAVSAALGLLGTFALLRAARSKGTADYKLLEVENRDSDVAAYAATYLLPFLVVFGGRWQDIASLAAFVVILGVIYVRSRLIYVNPTLALLGFRLWRVIPVTAGSDNADDGSAWPALPACANAPHCQESDHLGPPNHRRSSSLRLRSNQCLRKVLIHAQSCTRQCSTTQRPPICS